MVVKNEGGGGEKEEREERQFFRSVFGKTDSFKRMRMFRLLFEI